MFYAHSLPPDHPKSDWELLEDHLMNVAARASEFAAEFGAVEFGSLAGLWHDLGKYLPSFQDKLCGQQIHVDHAGPGAAAAVKIGPCLLAAVFATAGYSARLRLTAL